MKRIATLIAAGALVLAASSTASAQLNLSFGGGRGTTLSFGQPAYGGYGGYALPGGYGYAQQGIYSGYASPYSAYRSYGTNTYSPYTTGTTSYSSAYRGYVAPGTSIIQQRTYPTSPYGFSSGYPYGSTYPYSGYASPYGYQGVPLIRGNGFGINLVPR